MMDDFSVLENNLSMWEKKPELRRSYMRYFDLILEYCEPPHAVLELGAGFGAFSSYAREKGFARWFSSDILHTRFSDVVADAAEMPLKSNSMHHIVFVDVLHHLRHPLAMFLEASRVLVSGGCVVCVEPWITPFSWFVYRFFHHEGKNMNPDPENPFQNADGKIAYEGLSSLAMAVGLKISEQRWKSMGFQPPRIYLMNDFSYALTGGFSKRSLCPPWLIRMIRSIFDERLKFISSYAAMRALMVWKKL